jgi:hypothetical protein
VFLLFVHPPGIVYSKNMFENDAEKGYDVTVNNSLSSCLCFYGWASNDCSEMSCPLNFSFPNGFCSNGTCVCDAIMGYYGRNCSEQFGIVQLPTDGGALDPSYGIFEGGTIVTIRGTGFVDSDTMRCKFGKTIVVAHLFHPNPPLVPYSTCFSPGARSPQSSLFQFSVNNRFWTEPDSRLMFIYHGLGIVTGVR